MKKRLLLSLGAFLILFVASCGRGGASIDDPSLTPEEKDDVAYVKRNLEKGERLEEYIVARGAMPVELMADDFKRYRDEVYKAGLDYNSCKTRGIAQGMEKAQNKILTIQAEIVSKCSEWQVSQGTSEYIFVMATVKGPVSKGGKLSKLIAVFNPVTDQHDFTLPLTTPVVNNASMILSALNGELFSYATDGTYDKKLLAGKTTNTVVKFILEADPSTVR